MPDSKLFLAQTPAGKPSTGHDWAGYLRDQIKADWRPGEYFHDRLIFIPDPRNARTVVSVCDRVGCGVRLKGGRLCGVCLQQWRKAKANADYESWRTTPRQRRPIAPGCLVVDCLRGHAQLGLCDVHSRSFHLRRGARDTRTFTPAMWLLEAKPRGLPAVSDCRVPTCGQDRVTRSGLCGTHMLRFRTWSRTHQGATSEAELVVWLERENERYMDEETRTTFASVAATPFYLLPEPLRWEFLFAVQQLDLTGRSHFAAMEMRSVYLQFRRADRSSVVGLAELGRTGLHKANVGITRQWQREIDDAYRAWSGTDDRDPRVVYLRDLPAKKTSLFVGPEAKVDLRPIKHEWIARGVRDWAHSAPHGPLTVLQAAAAWKLADSVLTSRGTPIHALSVSDMDAVVGAIRAHWTNEHGQAAHILGISRVLLYKRAMDEPDDEWRLLPARFSVDRARHRAIGTASRSAANVDEPFRFIPQPIVDWLMDHLHLLQRHDEYSTAEARAIIFIHERCGRRTGETLGLADNCLSYDSQGAPYLEWRQGKPPYTAGKRLPIHTETHDVILAWREIKRASGVESQLLFPSRGYSRADRPYGAGYLSARVKAFVRLVNEVAPYRGPVEGPEGNLIHFDLESIDPYAFRHAFAQRFADAVDQDGRSTTPPDVLQDYMGHKNFNTTMAYYQVTAKRKKAALSVLPARRLNLLGGVVDVDRERDGFTKVAVTLGHCSEPQNVASNGHSCALEHACESCPFFLVDPLERDGISSKRMHLKVKLERAKVVGSPRHMLDHYEARIRDCSTIVDGIDRFIDALEPDERTKIRDALEKMAEIRRRASAPRTIDLRALLGRRPEDA